MLPDDPYKSILDRQESANYVKEHYKDAVALLREIVDYGTNLLIRCYHTNEGKDLTAAVILGTLLKNAISMVDAIEILVSKGAVYTAHLPGRGLFETYLYIKWILMDKTNRKVKQYYVWHIRQELLQLKISMTGTPENKLFLNFLGDSAEQFLEKYEPQQADIKKDTDSKETILNSNSFRDINKKFEKRKNKRSGMDVDWFKLYGTKNRFEIAKDLGLEAQYTILYKEYSDIMHASAADHHIKFNDDAIRFIPIRHLEDIRKLLRPIITFSMEIYRTILTHYRPDELINFSKNQEAPWMHRVRSIRKAKYNKKYKTLGE